ncbi:hypothetical protein OKW21_004353 [Catalinimonas alkaloidigena]|uniref:hypothetical protein n=1 Tax=Catalinimonas alkaloidigena TaxID=1075417 RepID=UPI0024065BC4|nr:hypothetical protein [Catalinimonas alkaloidigena]MDF9799090.1 hypothetical protein [Catalinimonas alkaloidigena]
MAKVKDISEVSNEAGNDNAAVLATPNFFDRGHEIPEKRNQFMKMEYGKNRFRFVGGPVSGFIFYGTMEREDGTETTKPYRRREVDGEFSVEEMINRNAKLKKDGEMERQKYFIASLVYNYQKEKLQVLEITQKSVLKALKSYVESEEYGHPSGYDLTVEKKGEGLNTDYTVVVSPPKPLSAEIETALGEVSCDLEKIFEGEYPLG